MARAIDADAIKEKFADILDSAYTDDYAKGVRCWIICRIEYAHPHHAEQVGERGGEAAG